MVMSATTASFWVHSEKASRAFEEQQWRDPSRLMEDLERAKKQAAWDRLSTTDKGIEWAQENRYQIVGASWVASMGASFGYVALNR